MQKHIQIKKKLVMTKNAEKIKKHKRKKHNRHSVPKKAEKSIKRKKKHNRHSVPKIDTQYMNRMVLSMY